MVCSPARPGRQGFIPAVIASALLAQGARADGPRPPVPAKSLPAAYLPSALQLRIGGFLGPSYSVELRGDSLLYRAREVDPGTGRPREATKLIKPTAAQWRRFWEAMDAAGVWRWRAEYASPGARDGTQWGLDLAYAGRRARSSGSNAYPGDEGGPAGAPGPEAGPPGQGRAFGAYLAAVEDLLGGERFR